MRIHKAVFRLLWHNSHQDETDLPGWRSAYLQIVEYLGQRNALMTDYRTVVELWKMKLD